MIAALIGPPVDAQAQTADHFAPTGPEEFRAELDDTNRTGPLRKYSATR